MTFKKIIPRFSFIFIIMVAYVSNGQNSKTFDLNRYHDYPTYLDISFTDNGRLLGDDWASSYVRNYSNYTLSFGIEFTINDYCGNSSIVNWPGGLILKPGRSEKEPYALTAKCKELQNSGNKKLGISSVTCRVISFKNLTEEENKRKEEREKKEKEQQLLKENKEKIEKQEAEEKERAENLQREKDSITERESASKKTQEEAEQIRKDSESNSEAQRKKDIEKEAEASNIERAENEKRQTEYDEWKKQATEQSANDDEVAASTSVAVLMLMGGFIYKDMGHVNPDGIYGNPKNDNNVHFYSGLDVGYSMSSFPLLFASEKRTLVNGIPLTTKSIEQQDAFTINLDVHYKLGFEHNNYGAYAFMAPKVGFNPLFTAFQVSPLVFGGRMFGGMKNVQIYLEYLSGKRTFTMESSDVEEYGMGESDSKFSRFEYGVRITTNPDANYRRNHILFGVIMEKNTIEGDGAYISTSDKRLIRNDESLDVGYTLQWRKDHTFSFYINYFDEHHYSGLIPKNISASNSAYDGQNSGTLIELGFIRSLDFWK